MHKQRIILSCSIGIGLLVSPLVSAGPWTPEENATWTTIAYQNSHVSYHLSPTGQKIAVGTIDEQTLYFQAEHGITDRLSVFAGLPWVSKKYVGPTAHRIQEEDGQISVSEEDDGHWHSGLQDITIGVQYRNDWGNWAVTPFAQFSTATNHYEYFAHAARGPRQDKLEIGVNAGRLLPSPLDRTYVQLGYSYAFLEGFEGVDPSRSTVTLETGYAATDRLAFRIFMIGQKTYHGLDYPFDYVFLRDRVTDRELYRRHDTTQRVDFIEAGVGSSYALSDRTSLFGMVYKTLWGENGHAIKYSFSMGINRAF